MNEFYTPGGQNGEVCVMHGRRECFSDLDVFQILFHPSKYIQLTHKAFKLAKMQASSYVGERLVWPQKLAFGTLLRRKNVLFCLEVYAAQQLLYFNAITRGHRARCTHSRVNYGYNKSIYSLVICILSGSLSPCAIKGLHSKGFKTPRKRNKQSGIISCSLFVVIYLTLTDALRFQP